MNRDENSNFRCSLRSTCGHGGLIVRKISVELSANMLAQHSSQEHILSRSLIGNPVVPGCPLIKMSSLQHTEHCKYSIPLRPVNATTAACWDMYDCIYCPTIKPLIFLATTGVLCAAGKKSEQQQSERERMCIFLHTEHNSNALHARDMTLQARNTHNAQFKT